MEAKYPFCGTIGSQTIESATIAVRVHQLARFLCCDKKSQMESRLLNSARIQKIVILLIQCDAPHFLDGSRSKVEKTLLGKTGGIVTARVNSRPLWSLVHSFNLGLESSFGGLDGFSMLSHFGNLSVSDRLVSKEADVTTIRHRGKDGNEGIVGLGLISWSENKAPSSITGVGTGNSS